MRGYFPWLARDCIMNVYRNHKKEFLAQQIPPPPITPESCIYIVLATTSTIMRKIGGPSKGETEDSNIHSAQAKIVAMNEITNVYMESSKT